ncbi:MAG: F0F1 ATP synthase subunit B [Porphyromonadaceae bacterium]|nr:F0F1 ATP synthase subunit B [Porphyromonadaceae bacterium]
MSLLSPEPGLLFWMMLSFGIVLFVLAKYGFPIILKMVDTRQNYIEESLQSARKAQEELARVKETGETLLANTRKEQAEILKETIRKKDILMEKAKEEARLEADKIIVAARDQINAEKEMAIRSIRNEVSRLSVDLAERILREKLVTNKDQMEMIDRLLDEIEISKS